MTPLQLDKHMMKEHGANLEGYFFKHDDYSRGSIRIYDDGCGQRFLVEMYSDDSCTIYQSMPDEAIIRLGS